MDLSNILLGEAVRFSAPLNVEVVLATTTRYPASGSYIDTKGLHRFGFLILAGAIAAEQTFQVEQATTVSGTPKDITGAVQVIATNGDNKLYIIEVDTAKLDINNGYRYVTLKNTGGGAGDYCSVIFFAIGERVPVTVNDLAAVVG